MKRFFPFTILFLIILAASACEQYECRNGDSYHMGDYYCDGDEEGCAETMMLFEKCRDRGCNLRTGKCNTWKDPVTGLRWSSLGGWRKRWNKAITYCDNLYEAGGHGWRLPTINELEGIYGRGSTCENVFNDFYDLCSSSGTDTSFQYITSCGKVESAGKNPPVSPLMYVRCVRDE